MIWSLLKVVLFVAVVAGLTFGASILVDTGGGIRIAAAGYGKPFCTGTVIARHEM